MSKLVIIPSDSKDISKIKEDILLGITGYSVNCLTITIEELKKVIKTHKNIFISLNKNFTNNELKGVEELLIFLSKNNIKGIFYYDVAILNITKKLNLKIDLIWAAEHLTTNYYTINYWLGKGVVGTFLSNEITKEEMLTIRLNTDSKLFVQLFGYIPMYVSKRHAIKNYLRHFDLDIKASNYQLFKEDKTYSIIDNNEGTMIYSNFILNGLREYLELKDKIDYIIINGYKIVTNLLDKVIDIFNKVTENNVDDMCKTLESIFNNLESGFLYEESVYRVKKDEK